MADVLLSERSALAGLWRPGRFGTAGPEPGVVIREPPPVAMALLAVRKGQPGALARAAKTWGVELPVEPRWVQGRDLLFLWAGPSQWLVRGGGSFEEITTALGDLAPFGVLIDQGHSRVTLGIAGTRARDVLAKGFDVDLHPRVFGPGHVALTQAAGISVCLWQLDPVPSYGMAVPASFAASFWEWLSEAAAEYGYVVEGQATPGDAKP